MQHVAKTIVLVALGACTTTDTTIADTAPSPLYGSVLDERADAIDFSSGAPVHTHQGSAIDLSQACPSVYKYAYLESRTPFGSESNANPLEWHVASGAASVYRVRLADGTIALDWTRADDPDVVRLDRDAIGDYTGAMYLDVQSNEGTVDTACWENHPLAAPLDIAAATHGELFDWTLAAHSAISTAINPSGLAGGAAVFAQPFVQYVDEPVTLHFDHSQIVGTVFGTVATESIATVATNAVIACDNPLGCTIETASVASTTPLFKPLVATFPLRVVDLGTGAIICRGFDAIDGCTIPPRAIGEPPHSYAAIIAMSGSSLDPAPGFETSEQTIVDLSGVATSFTGAITATSTRCTAADGATCTAEQTVVDIAALTDASVAFAPLHTIVATSVGPRAGLEPIGAYVPTAYFTLNSAVWDAGSAGL